MGLALGVLGAGGGSAQAGAQPTPPFVVATFAPTLTLVEVNPGGTQLDAVALSSEPASLTYSLKRADARSPFGR